MNNIYENLNLLPLDIQGWNGNSIVFEKLISGIRPRTIIEVGTWKGQSAITMANTIKNLKLDCKLYCVDTWLGALEFLTAENDASRDLKYLNGYPQVYYQFLSNVVHTQNENIIIPLPNTTKIGYEYLSKLNIKADIIYIDASHDEQSVYEDITMYINLLNWNGVIFGDDYYSWGGVKLAVDRYCSEHNFKLDVFENNFWIIQNKINL